MKGRTGISMTPEKYVQQPSEYERCYSHQRHTNIKCQLGQQLNLMKGKQ